MSLGACKIILNNSVEAQARTAASLIASRPGDFPAATLESLLDLDHAWLGAHAAILAGDEKTRALVAAFRSAIAARSAALAADRATQF
jgi:hypothetical protein